MRPVHPNKNCQLQALPHRLRTPTLPPARLPSPQSQPLPSPSALEPSPSAWTQTHLLQAGTCGSGQPQAPLLLRPCSSGGSTARPRCTCPGTQALLPLAGLSCSRSVCARAACGGRGDGWGCFNCPQRPSQMGCADWHCCTPPGSLTLLSQLRGGLAFGVCCHGLAWEPLRSRGSLIKRLGLLLRVLIWERVGVLIMEFDKTSLRCFYCRCCRCASVALLAQCTHTNIRASQYG